jgi:hypothetical protein
MMNRLTSTQDAIKQAIEGGFVTPKLSSALDLNAFAVSMSLLDPRFWQALGKARWWPYKSAEFIYEWPHFANEWFEIRMSGGDEKKFWDGLP